MGITAVGEDTSVNLEKQLDEKQTRRNLIHHAYNAGGNELVQELLIMMRRHEKLLAGCKTPFEISQVRIMCVAEVYKLLGLTGSLSVDGMQIF
jgi:hypothetical protein